MEPAQDKRKNKDYWSDCGLGKEPDVLKAIETGELPDYLTPQERRVLCHVLELRKEILRNEPKEYQPRSPVRGRPTGTFKRRQANPRQTTQRRKPALY